MNFPRSLFHSRAAACADHKDQKAAGGRLPGAWWHQVTGRLFSATIFQIPVAFEDEAGFHPVGQAEADLRFSTLKLELKNKF